MVKLEEAVVQVTIVGFHQFRLVESLGHVAFGIEVFRTDLSNVHVNEQRVVAINLKQLLFCHVGIQVVVNMNVLMRKNHIRAVGWNARSFGVENLCVVLLFVLINSEVEVLLADHLIVGVCSQVLVINETLEFQSFNLLSNDFVNLALDLLQVGVV